ncbi:MAG: hypothetical protein B7Z57_14365 [Acidiphilium sp. 37-60-79]|nr:MAG: hypothetical protein B7Z57_14365 [Acidiphilium sp. 37-60-79]
MGEWFNQARFDLNELSTKGLIEFVKEQVDSARFLAGRDFAPRPPEELRREARADVEWLFRDKVAAVVLNEAGQTSDVLLRALDAGKFETVLSGLDKAIHYGSEQELPNAAALAAPGIEGGHRTICSKLHAKPPKCGNVKEHLAAAGSLSFVSKID